MGFICFPGRTGEMDNKKKNMSNNKQTFVSAIGQIII